MGKGYEDLKDFQKLYLKEGPYHLKASGYKKWFLEDNYRAIARECTGGRNILDLACGEGCLGEYVTCDYLAGVDNSAAALELNRQIHPALYSELYLSDIRNLMEISFNFIERFDHITCSLSLMYILKKDLEEVLKQISELLESQGFFIFTYPLFHRYRQSSREADEIGYKELSRILLESGFGIEKIYPFCPIVPKEIYDMSMDPQKEKEAYRKYTILKNQMTLDNAYHFLCKASKKGP